MNIEPALCRPQWKHGQFECDDGTHFEALRVSDDIVPQEGLHIWLGGKQERTMMTSELPKVMALANAALPDGDPYKLTYEDLDSIRAGIVALRQAECRHSATALADVAAKLTALLPPHP